MFVDGKDFPELDPPVASFTLHVGAKRLNHNTLNLKCSASIIFSCFFIITERTILMKICDFGSYCGFSINLGCLYKANKNGTC